MMTALIEINAHEKSPELIGSIKKQLGKNVTFSNGCYVSLVTDDGVFWGQCPYGTTWACNDTDGFADKIATWVDYWNAPRDETGTKLNIS
jgi:hypothetical protein